MTQEMYKRFGINTSVKGQVFGRLTIVGASFFASLTPNTKRHSRVVARCECGNSIIVRIASLKSGTTASCGCLHGELLSQRQLKHGFTIRSNRKPPEYGVWASLIQRCTNRKCSNFSDYGGRGIGVCDRWKESFEAFYSDMGPRPSAKHSIDRINNDGNYEPGNCQWAMKIQQNRNSRHNRMITIDGHSRCVTEWSEILGISSQLVYDRLHRGWSDNDAVLIPKQL